MLHINNTKHITIANIYTPPRDSTSTHYKTTSAWRSTHTSHIRAPTAPRLIIQRENTQSITSLTQIYNILQHSKAKKHYLQQRPLHNKHSHRPPHSHYNRHKTNMRHIHTSIVSRHLATRANNKILRALPPHISIPEHSFSASLVAPLPNSEQINHPFLKSYLHKEDAKSHPSPMCPSVIPTHTTHIISLSAPHMHHVVHPWICWQTPLEWLSCWPDGWRSSFVDYKRKDRTPPSPANNTGQGSG